MSFRSRIMVLFVLSLFSVVAGAAFAGTPYTLTDLGVTVLGGMSYVDTYNGGLVVAGYNSVSGNYNGWYWTKSTGAVNVLPSLPSAWGATGCTATGVNSSGQIVGMYYTTSAQDATGAFVYTIGGTAQQINLPSAGFITTSVEGIGNISEDGSVPLYYGTGIPPGTAACPAVYNVNTQAFTYPGGSGATGTGYGTLPIVISANNNLIGGTDISVTGHAKVWNGSTWNDIAPLSGSNTNYAYGINSHGDIVGKAIQSGWKAIYALYNSGTGTWDAATNLFSGSTKGVAYGINDDRLIVGATGTNAGAYIWTTPGTGNGVALSSMVTPSSLSTWSLMAGSGISNGADIVGWGTNPSGTTSEAFLLTPLTGDANLDGKVDINDLSKVLSNYDKTSMSWTDGDFNGDGKVDINDLSVVLTNYDRSLGASADGMAAVPEPAGLVLVAMLLPTCLWALRRRART